MLTSIACYELSFSCLLTRQRVSVEPEATETSPTKSPAKIHTSLQSTSPSSTQLPAVQETPDTPALRIDEGKTVVHEQAPATPQASPTKSGIVRNTTWKKFSTTGPADLQLLATPTTNMDSSVHLLGEEIFRGFERPSTSQTGTPHFSQFLEQTAEDDSGQVGSSFATHSREAITGSIYPDIAQPSLRITRQEILTLTSVLERIPQEYMMGEEVDPNHSLPLMIVDEAKLPLLLATSYQEDTSAQVASEEISAVAQVENPVVVGKRRRPKYSITGSMLKKQPVLKFSATRPLDKDKTPYKGWCTCAKRNFR